MSGRLQRLSELVGETGSDGLSAIHPGLLLEERLDVVGGLPGLVGVGHDQGVLDLVEQFGIAAHVVRISALDAPGLMHHHHGVLGHVDGVSGHGDDRGHRGRQAIDVHVDAGRVVAQQVIDRRPLEDVAARGVDVQVDLVQVAHCLEVSSELQRGDAPDADLVVQQHLGDAATGSLDAVPGLMRGVGLSQRRRHRQHQAFMDQGLMAAHRRLHCCSRWGNPAQARVGRRRIC